jgi:hypothetical protein
MQANVEMRLGCNALAGAIRKRIGQSLVGQVLVEQFVNPTVSRFLANKTFDLAGHERLFLGWQLFEALSDRVNEKLFSHRKSHRQGIEESRSEGVASVPSLCNGRIQVN